MEWIQIYDPAGNAVVSTLLAALPIVVLLALLGLFEIPAQWAALAGLAAAVFVSIFFYGMPAANAAATVVYGAAFGLLPIGWIILAAVFLYNLTVKTGQFDTVKSSVAALSPDRRIQALLIAFSFGAFIEGAAGFGTPVAICAALMMGLGFPPLYAAGLALIANTAPVAFGALGTPILTLAAVTQQDAFVLGQMAGRQLPFVSLLIPIWMVVTMSGWKGFVAVWPVVLISGGSFAVTQFLWSNLIGPELVDIAGGLVSLAMTAVFAAWWKPADNWEFSQRQIDKASRLAAAVQARQAAGGSPGRSKPAQAPSNLPSKHTRAEIVRAWMPWAFLSLFVFVWGLPHTKALLSGGPKSFAAYRATGKAGPNHPVLAPQIPVPSLHKLVYRDYPVIPTRIDPARVAEPGYKAQHGEGAIYTFNWLSATGSGILVAALLTALYLRIPLRVVLEIAGQTLRRMKWPLLTIACMLALGFVTRYGGSDATLGLAFTKTGVVYPFFAALLGWLGVALTGSDTSSNVLFGSLQKITAQQLGLSPILITTANSTGGVMGKMIDAQSIVVSTAATDQSGHEGSILRFVFWHSIALACIMGLIVLLQAYVFTWMIPE